MKRLLSLVAFFATLHASAQQVNPVPDYVFRNQMSVGRGTVTDTAAYFSIGPRYGANKGFMPPIVGDTATFSSGKRNGLLIFSVQKNKFLYWDSVRVQWSDMAGSSGSYITGSGITGYLPQFSASTTLDTSALFTLGNRLGIGTSTFAYNSTNTANMELNGTAGGILGFKRNDSARGYLWHTGSDMELANTTAGSISFNTNSATRGSISSAGVWRLHNLAGTGDRVVQASSNGTLSATTSVTGLVDTTTISTRAWRQKGLDSLAALEVSGSGTTNYVAKFTAGSTIGNSQIFDNGTNVGIGTGTPLAKLHVGNGSQSATNGASTKAQIMDGNSGGRAALLTLATSSGAVVVEGQYESDASGADLRVIMGSTTNHPVVMRTNNAERLRITSGGNVGIGTTNPLAKLDVASGHIKIDDAFSFYWGAASTSINGSSTTNIIDLYTNSAVRQRIFANGRVGINTTTDAGYQLDVNGNGRYIGAASTNSGLIVQNSTGASGTAQYYMDFGTSATLISRMFRGNGLSGTTANGLNIDNFEGFQVRANQLGGSGGTINLMGGNVGVATTSPSYTLDINGTLRSVNGANFATTSGQVGIGKTSPSAKSKLDVEGNIDIADGSFYYLRNAVANTGTYGMYYSNSAPKYPIRLAVNADPTNNRFFEIGWHKNDNKDSTWNPTFSVNSYNAETFINTTTDAGDYKLQVSGNIYNTGSAVLAATSGNVGIGTASPGVKLDIGTTADQTLGIKSSTSNYLFAGTYQNYAIFAVNRNPSNGVFTDVNKATADIAIGGLANEGLIIFNTTATNNSTATERMRLTASGELLISTTTDAGDYKLQVVGNARVGTGKLDIASNTTFGLGVARSGTSEVAGQIYNSNGILYTGVESSAGGQIFSGSSAYAAVIGSGAAYPLQFATNNVTRATLNTDGELLINTLSDQGAYNLQVNGSMYNTGQVTRGTINTIGTGAQLSTDSTTNIPAISINQSLTGASAQSLISATTTWNTTGNPSLLEFNVTNTASGATANYLRISDGTNIFRVTKDAGLFTSAPSGGTARKWKFGSAATVSPTSPNRTIQIEVDGVVYYLHAKTTND